MDYFVQYLYVIGTQYSIHFSIFFWLMLKVESYHLNFAFQKLLNFFLVHFITRNVNNYTGKMTILYTNIMKLKKKKYIYR